MRMLKAVGVVLLLLQLSGCAHRPVKVNCEGPLTPINAPAPKESAKATTQHETTDTR